MTRATPRTRRLTIAQADAQRGQALSIATCIVGGKRDATLIATVRMDDVEWYQEALWVRRYDIRTGKFASYPTKGVRCLNEARGL